MTTLTTPPAEPSFDWRPQPQAGALVNRLLSEYIAQHARLANLGTQMLLQTGTRLVDWLDHLVVPPSDAFAHEAASAGYAIDRDREATVWRHAGGMFPPLVTAESPMHGNLVAGVAIKVEDVDFFLQAHGLTGKVATLGILKGPLRSALVEASNDVGFWIVERHGFDDFAPPTVTAQQITAAQEYFQRFTTRKRKFNEPADGFAHARQLIREAQDDIGLHWATDRFSAAERAYWQGRNRAAQAQYARQQRLGLGWANHDHHTYRSSRQCFGDLIATLELMGFECRERFYAGREAGWGAQVLEQHRCGLCVFADVDLSPDEVAQDFAHQPLAERDQLGTVGLWCALHGEAFLEAGMHHLEAQFSFEAAREQLQQAGIESMKPFTDLPFLRQAFTAGEMWPVEPTRIDRLLSAGKITAEQADKFRRDGALGSHLEVLQRDDGYKGFNQTGISDIISRTDPRRGA
ncbi:MAG: hypothetical protein WD894_15575 [Pirellulales bacterium]